MSDLSLRHLVVALMSFVSELLLFPLFGLKLDELGIVLVERRIWVIVELLLLIEFKVF